jgi:hypothetical protein
MKTHEYGDPLLHAITSAIGGTANSPLSTFNDPNNLSAVYEM